MKNYKFTRALDGAAVDDLRTLTIAEAAPLLASGAIEEIGGAPATDSAPESPAPAPVDAAPAAPVRTRAKKANN
jgi:hypothetical protein